MFGIGNHDGEKCPTHDLNARADKTFVAGLTFYEFNRILAGACTGLACLVSFIHIWRHATHLTVPRQQVKVMRVISLVPLYAIVNLLCVCFPDAQVYLDPILELLQALCLASYFMLLCEYISPHTHGRSGFFAQIEIKDKKAEGGVVQDGVKWFSQRCFAIFQYPVVALAVAIATIITQAAGVYCQFESRVGFANLWLSIATTMSSGLAIGAVVLVAVQLKKHMPRLRPISKLVAIKLVVGLAFLQQVVFWILQSTHVLRPSARLTYADLHYGIPSLLSCLEMVPIALVLVWAYPVGPYRLDALDARREERGEHGNNNNSSSNGVDGQNGRHDYAYVPSSYQGGFLGLRAFTSMLNPVDVIKATVAAFAMAARERANRSSGSGSGRTTYAASSPYRPGCGGHGSSRHGDNGYGYGRVHDYAHGNEYTGYNGSYQMDQSRR